MRQAPAGAVPGVRTGSRELFHPVEPPVPQVAKATASGAAAASALLEATAPAASTPTMPATTSGARPTLTLGTTLRPPVHRRLPRPKAFRTGAPALRNHRRCDAVSSCPFSENFAHLRRVMGAARRANGLKSCRLSVTR